MNMTTSRLLIETVIRRAIKEMEDSPKRTLRKLVDMALSFSSGSFQSFFFRSAQTMLKNENSAYYNLFQDIVAHVEEDRLIDFGINVGYHGCTLGARKIRETESLDGYNIPWSVTLHISPETYLQTSETYDSIISQGESMGICTWQLHMSSRPELLLPMAAAHPDCAFVIFCSPSDVSPCLIDGAMELTNIMLAIHYEENVEHVCHTLRSNGLLFSVYYTYKPEDLEYIINDDLFHSIQQLHPVFTALTSDSLCPKVVSEIVHEHILALREKQILQTIPWELDYDCRLIDSIISNETCIAEFNTNGSLNLRYGKSNSIECNLFQHNLKSIFQAAFPKTK